MFRKIIESAIWLFFTVSTQCAAMEISTGYWNGREVVLANGEVVNGDAQRFMVALASISRAQHGVPIVILNSSGGSVDEAFRVSDVFSRIPVHTVVPKGAQCASACASIIFIAGKYRTIEEGGEIGQHSCSRGGVKDQKCNDLLSENALNHGISYGSIAAFVTYASPKEMIWFTRSQADCFGLTNYPYTVESGFEKSEPCVIEVISGRKGGSQSAWRVDFKNDGYRAFLRPVSDDEREMELNLFCDNKKPGVFCGFTVKINTRQ